MCQSSPSRSAFSRCSYFSQIAYQCGQSPEVLSIHLGNRLGGIATRFRASLPIRRKEQNSKSQSRSTPAGGGPFPNAERRNSVPCIRGFAIWSSPSVSRRHREYRPYRGLPVARRTHQCLRGHTISCPCFALWNLTPHQPLHPLKAPSKLAALQARIVKVTVDRYGRIVGRVYVNELNINRELVVHGFAWVYRKYSDDAELLALEAKAKKKGLGLWADPDPIPPWEWRKGTRTP